MGNVNSDQIEYWNGRAGQTWVEAQDRLDRLLAPISAALLERAAVREGERVLDVGCGCGDSAIALAAAGASVRGVDISEPMLQRARARAEARRGGGTITFIRADASTCVFEPEHELVISRFGVMFFEDPPAAFTNIRSALAPRGRLCFVCWQTPRLNPWIAVAGQAVQPFLPPPEQEPDPRAPGPFAFADPDDVTAILDRAGFVDVVIEPLTATLHLADDLEGAMELLTLVGPLSRVLADLDESTRHAALAAVREALKPHLTETGVDLGSACWLVSARAG